MAGTRTVGEGQGKLAWCLSSPAQGCPRLSSAREQQGGSSLARANEEGVSPVSEQKILCPLISHSLFASCRGHLDRHHVECRLEWGTCHFISLLLFMVLDRHTQAMGRDRGQKARESPATPSA